jgi:4-hydroxysphinganine ceramide fatty acyl 2-hydroxylase
MNYTIHQVEEHNQIHDAWVVYNGNVYDITDYLEERVHPGGSILISEYFGKDISQVFHDNNIHGHSIDALKTLEFYQIGQLIN